MDEISNGKRVEGKRPRNTWEGAFGWKVAFDMRGMDWNRRGRPEQNRDIQNNQPLTHKAYLTLLSKEGALQIGTILFYIYCIS